MPRILEIRPVDALDPSGDQGQLWVRIDTGGEEHLRILTEKEFAGAMRQARADATVECITLMREHLRDQ